MITKPLISDPDPVPKGFTIMKSPRRHALSAPWWQGGSLTGGAFGLIA
jgi:hypothetical protein